MVEPLALSHDLGREVDATGELSKRIRALSEEHEFADYDEFAAFLLRDGPRFFLDLTPIDQHQLVRHYVNKVLAKRRTEAIKSERFSEPGKTVTPMIRIAPEGRHYWSSTWMVNGKLKQVRELTENDLVVLIKQQYGRVAEARARCEWLLAVAKMAKNHKVKTLGDLEKKGIDLPTIEVPEEA